MNPVDLGASTSMTRWRHSQARSSRSTAFGPERRNANRDRFDPDPVAGRDVASGQRRSMSNRRRRVCMPDTNGPGSGLAGTKTSVSTSSTGQVSLRTTRKARSVASLPGPLRSAMAAATRRSRRRSRLSVVKVSAVNGLSSLSVCLNCVRSRRPPDVTTVRSSNRSPSTNFLSTCAAITVPSTRSTSRLAANKSWYSYPRWAGWRLDIGLD